MIRNTYMTTGEFAKLMKVSKHTLFHYDDIGLFCPELVGENEYRYYSIYQMETFNTILLLKKLGMSLQEIKAFLDERSPERFLSVFDTREKQIDDEIAKLQEMKRWITQRKAKTEYLKTRDFSSVSILPKPRRYYLCNDVADFSDTSFFLKVNQLILEFEASHSNGDYDIAYFQHPEFVEHGIYDHYDNVLLLLQEKSPSCNVKTLPEGDYLTAYHIGHWESIGEAYERLFAYQKAHHIVTDGDYLEYYVVDNFTAKDISSYVTEISVRVVPSFS